MRCVKEGTTLSVVTTSPPSLVVRALYSFWGSPLKAIKMYFSRGSHAPGYWSAPCLHFPGAASNDWCYCSPLMVQLWNHLLKSSYEFAFACLVLALVFWCLNAFAVVLILSNHNLSSCFLNCNALLGSIVLFFTISSLFTLFSNSRSALMMQPCSSEHTWKWIQDQCLHVCYWSGHWLYSCLHPVLV